MVDSVEIDDAGGVDVTVLLTVAGCPLKDTINRDVTAAVAAVDGISDVRLTLGVMTDEQRAGLKEILSDGKAQREIPFAQPGSLTKVFAIASGKGGVGKSSVTVNLALGMAAQGLKVGVVDADIYGHSVPAMLGVADSRPTQVDDLIMPVPTASGVSVISIGMLKPRRDQVVVVTTPQEAAAEVAERAGTMASMMHQRVVGVVENMSYLPCPHCTEEGREHRLEVFGSGGGQRVAETLSSRFGYDVPVLGQVPLDTSLREGGDAGKPIVESDPTAPAAAILRDIAQRLAGRGRGLAGMQLGLTPANKL